VADPHQHVVFVAAMTVAAVAGYLDWRKGEIPNALTVPAIVFGPVLHAVRFAAAKEPMEAALSEGALSIGGALLCAVVPMILFRQSAIGGGDVKLLIALGALLQPLAGIEAQMYGFVAGAVLAPARLAYEGKLLATLKNAIVIGGNLFLPSSRQRSVDATVLSSFRLGPAVAVGVALACYLRW
jgi:prepilin peptidase CpaA